MQQHQRAYGAPEKRWLDLVQSGLLIRIREGEEWDMCPDLQKASQGYGYLSCLIWGANRELAFFGATENKGSKREPAVPQTPDGIRG